MSAAFKPMLAGKAKPDKLSYPVFVQAKLDGIRASVVGGRLLTRTLKEVPNREIFNELSKPEFEGLDGELIVGSPTAEDCYRTTASFVMASGKTGQAWTFYAFDLWNTDLPYRKRKTVLADRIPSYPSSHVSLVYTAEASDEAALLALEASFIEQGLEGAILRGGDSLYKFGRGSVTAQDLLKLKRFEDSEATIIGAYEEMHNANEAKTNALGRTERSSHQAGKIGKGTLGGFHVRDIHTGVEFSVGSGFKAADREQFWLEQNELVGRIVKYKFFTVGVKDKPRHPVFLGFRDPIDL